MEEIPFGCGSRGLCDGEEVDGLEQVALPAAVASLDEDEAGAELEGEAPVVAEVEEIEAGQVDVFYPVGGCLRASMGGGPIERGTPISIFPRLRGGRGKRVCQGE